LKRDLFARIFAALRPAGVFINAEQILGPTAALEEAYRQAWLADARTLGASPAEIDAVLLRIQEDRCAPLESQLHWLREIGFEDPDCWFKEGRFAVNSARKPS
jgi:tRNA (cmo5U34)-methyltransferase